MGWFPKQEEEAKRQSVAGKASIRCEPRELKGYLLRTANQPDKSVGVRDREGPS